MTMIHRSWGFVSVSLISLALGCAFGTALPTRKVGAQPATGGPQGIDQLTAGLDQVAAHAPPGTVYSPPTRTSQYVCVKGSATL
jgi:hypothetical protein